MTDNSTEIGDVQLIHAWINGDARAFDMLYDRYKQPLYGYLHNLFRGENANIDDIFQRTWLKVIEHLPKYQDQEKFSAWLMRIAGNLAIDFFRSRKRRSEDVYDDRMEAVLPAPPSAAPDAEIRRQELIDATAVAVTELAPEIRQVFLQRWLAAGDADPIQHSLPLFQKGQQLFCGDGRIGGRPKQVGIVAEGAAEIAALQKYGAGNLAGIIQKCHFLQSCDHRNSSLQLFFSIP